MIKSIKFKDKSVFKFRMPIIIGIVVVVLGILISFSIIGKDETEKVNYYNKIHPSIENMDGNFFLTIRNTLPTSVDLRVFIDSIEIVDNIFEKDTFHRYCFQLSNNPHTISTKSSLSNLCKIFPFLRDTLRMMDVSCNIDSVGNQQITIARTLLEY